jgi:hypothetical protein
MGYTTSWPAPTHTSYTSLGPHDENAQPRRDMLFDMLFCHPTEASDVVGVIPERDAMNRYYEEKWSWIEGAHFMRTQALDMFNDADLAFNPGGEALSLGALCREMGEVEHSYIQSLKTFQQDWSYRNTDAGLERSVTRLKEWFQQLDGELQAIVLGFSDDDLRKSVDRGKGSSLPVDFQLDAYLQAILIFFGKLTIYLRIMDKPMPALMREYIG